MSRFPAIPLATLVGVLCAPTAAPCAPSPVEALSGTAAPSSSSVAWLPPAITALGPTIDSAARTHGVDARLVAIVIYVESRGRARAVSPAGALGLMQMMPKTAAAVARAHGLPAPTRKALLDPAVNIDLGTRHLAALISDFGDPALDDATVQRVATAYNGGAAVLLEPRAPSRETRRYAARVLQLWGAKDASVRP